MWEGYLNALDEFINRYETKSAKISVDRFHVAQHYRAGFDDLRKQEMKRLKKALPDAVYQRDCQGTLWLLRHNHKALAEEDRDRLRRLLAHSSSLHQAYTWRTELTAIFDLALNPAQGKQRLLQWIAKVERSSLTCFDKAIKTIGNHLDRIANYFIRRATSGFVEGLNNKVKVIKRRCYGIKKVDTLFQRLWLDLQGYARFA